MRIDLAKIARSIPLYDIESQLLKMGETLGIVPSIKLWNDYIYSMQDAPMLAFA